MTIPEGTLKNSLATAAAYTDAIYRGMQDWLYDKTIEERVTGIQAPTFVRLGPGTGDGEEMCRSAKPPEPPVLRGKEDLISALRAVSQYLDMLGKSV